MRCTLIEVVDLKAIAQLACQFIEQAKAVDKELDLFKDGMFDEGSILLLFSLNYLITSN